MKFKDYELINAGIMSETIYVVVEGIDDISMYDLILSGIDSSYEITPCELVDGFSAGGSEVERLIEKLSLENDDLRFILGIVDKDVRDYRNEIKQDDSLLTLKVYSVESHFVNKESLAKVLRSLLKVDSSLVDSHLLEMFMAEFLDCANYLYLCSLESLQGAVDPDYNADFCYSLTHGKLHDELLREKIFAKKVALEKFAHSKQISLSLDSLKSISKGKWLLNEFANAVQGSIGILSTKCGQMVTSCKYCTVDYNEKCLYRPRYTVSQSIIRSHALDAICEEEIAYIRDAVRKKAA